MQFLKPAVLDLNARTEVGMPVKTKKPSSGAYRTLSELMIPNTGRWFVYSKMDPICVQRGHQKIKVPIELIFRERKGKLRKKKLTHGGDGGDRGRQQVRVERDLAGARLLRAPAAALARPRRRLVRAGPGPRGHFLLRLARRLARRGQGRVQPASARRRRPAEERAREAVVGLVSPPRPQALVS